MKSFTPYADDESTVSIGDLSIENGRDSVAIHGSLDVRRDAEGLKQAKALLGIVADIVEKLEADPLDAKPEGIEEGGTIANPFG